MVTPNITADVTTNMDPQVQARLWQLQDRARAKSEARQAQRMAEQGARRAEAEQEGKIRGAYEKIYGPVLQSGWDQRQGKIIGVNPRSMGGPQPAGTNAYIVKDQWGMPTGRYEYKPDTNMPAGMYNQRMGQAYDMWRAIKLLGMDKEPEKLHVIPGRGGGSGGGSKEAGATYSGPAGGMTQYQWR